MSVKFGIAPLLALVLVGFNGGTGWAGVPAFPVVNIDDLTDTPSVTVSFVPVTPTILPDTAGEFLHFTLPVPTNSSATTFYTDFFEDVVGGTLSDRLVVSHTAGSPTLNVQFASDPASITLPPGATNLLNLVETGAFQFAGTFTFPELIGGYVFQVRSDRADVPAPATLLLLGSALVALGGVMWRRGRRHPRRPRSGLLCLPSRASRRKT